MKLFAPEYYKDFTCIADKCRHSCCIGWEIDIDPETAKKYGSLVGRYSESIKNSITASGDTTSFRLTKSQRCPHLDENGLCKIITELGQGFLCEICREHPRFYNKTSIGLEVGIGMACEEACRIILSSDGYDKMIPIGDIVNEEHVPLFDAVKPRERIFALLKDGQSRYREKVSTLAHDFGFTDVLRSSDRLKVLFASLEYLNEENRELFCSYSYEDTVPQSLEKPLTRSLAYFIYRHCSCAESERDFAASLGFCLAVQELMLHIAKRTQQSLCDIARVISEELEYSEDNTEQIKLEFIM